jgi:predicted Zn-dependent protease
MDADARRALAARILERSRCRRDRGDRHERHRALTRFTHERIHQNVDVEDVTIRVRAIVDGRTGVATTNAPTTRDRATVERALEIAAFAPRDRPPHVRRKPSYAPPARRVRGRDRWRDARRARAKSPRDLRRSRAPTAAGARATSRRRTSGVTIATTAGADASFDGTECGANVKMTDRRLDRLAERYGTDARDLDGDALGRARRAESRASSADPVAVEPGEWTVILEPAAAGELRGDADRALLGAVVRRRLVVPQPAGSASA